MKRSREDAPVLSFPERKQKLETDNSGSPAPTFSPGRVTESPVVSQSLTPALVADAQLAASQAFLVSQNDSQNESAPNSPPVSSARAHTALTPGFEVPVTVNYPGQAYPQHSVPSPNTSSDTHSQTTSAPPTPDTASPNSTTSRAPVNPKGEDGGAAERASTESILDRDLSMDREVWSLIQREAARQANWLNLVASENYVSRSVMQAEGSLMMNKYSEGYPGMRHYGGNEVIDQMEQLCQERALTLYDLDPTKWGVNVQSLAGTQANSQVYHALMKPHERLMGLSLTHGGHMSFGYQTDKLKVSCVSAYYDTLPYEVDLSSGRIDYDDLEKLAMRFRPKVIVAGASSYCRLINYQRLKSICQNVGAYLVVDMAHISGQIAAKLLPTPFEYADVVTTAAQKTLRGPRGAMIFFRKELEGPINFSVFPASQGGPHNHTIAALTVALGQANTREFREYQRQLMSNAKSLEQALLRHGFSLVSGGTDIHMVVVSLVDKGIDGARVNAACERSHIALSATAVPGDKWALPRAVRIGTTPMTTRGLKEHDFERVVSLLDKIVGISVRVQAALPESANKLRDFKAALSARLEFDEIVQEVSDWVSPLLLPRA